MTDYEYAQAVMAAAGVVHDKQCNCCACAGCSGLAHCTAVSIYPDPLKSGDAFLALWDALEYSGHYLTFQSRDAGCKVTIGVGVGKNGRTSHVVGKSQNKDRKAALVEAAGRALGVTR